MTTIAEWTTWGTSIVNGDNGFAYGNHLPLTAGQKLTQLKFYMRRTGTPAGNVRARIGTHAQSNGTYLKEFGDAVVCSGMSDSMTWVTFTDEYTIPDTGDYHVYVYFDGNHSFPSNYVAVAQYTPHTLGELYLKVSALLYTGAFTHVGANGYIVCFNVGGVVPSVYPSNATARVTGLRRVYRPGSYRLEATIGDVSATVDIVQKEKVPVKISPEAEIELPKPTVPDFMRMMAEELTVTIPPAPGPQNLWQMITPWKEEEGETVGAVWEEVRRRARVLTPWKEEEGETFGEEVMERARSFGKWASEFWRGLWGK